MIGVASLVKNKVDNLIITIFLKSSNRADKDRPSKTHCRDFLTASAALTGLKMDEGGEYIPSLVQLTLEGIVHHEHTLLPESIYHYTTPWSIQCNPVYLLLNNMTFYHHNWSRPLQTFLMIMSLEGQQLGVASSRDARPAPTCSGPGKNTCPGLPQPQKNSRLPCPAPSLTVAPPCPEDFAPASPRPTPKKIISLPRPVTPQSKKSLPVHPWLRGPWRPPGPPVKAILKYWSRCQWSSGLLHSEQNDNKKSRRWVSISWSRAHLHPTSPSWPWGLHEYCQAIHCPS